MNFIIKHILVLFFISINGHSFDEFEYILICTSKNCTPCVKTADDYFIKHKNKCVIINLYSNLAEKQYTKELIENYSTVSVVKKIKVIKEVFIFGKNTFHSSDNGPFLIKYSKNDTIIYNASNFDNIE